MLNEKGKRVCKPRGKNYKQQRSKEIDPIGVFSGFSLYFKTSIWSEKQHHGRTVLRAQRLRRLQQRVAHQIATLASLLNKRPQDQRRARPPSARRRRRSCMMFKSGMTRALSMAIASQIRMMLKALQATMQSP